MRHHIRLADKSDAKALLKIYTPYIRYTAISFETKIPTVAAFSRRIRDIGEQYPFLVYEIDGEPVGYAYATRFRDRAAYCYDAEVSIYLSTQYQGGGFSLRLYNCLLDVLRELGCYNVYAACALPNAKSCGFHQKLGFNYVGTFRKTGYKFGKWHDVAWFEKAIHDHGEAPGELKSIREISEEVLNSIFERYAEVED